MRKSKQEFSHLPKGAIFELFLIMDYRRAAPIKRTKAAWDAFQVHCSISDEKLTRKAKEGFTAANAPVLSMSFTLFYLPAIAFIVATMLARPLVKSGYESHFHTLPQREHFYLGIALIVFGFSWWPLALRRYKSALAQESSRTAFYLCCRTLITCHSAAEGKASLLYLDRRMHYFTLSLVRFGKSGAPQLSPKRQQQLLEHASRVSVAFNSRSERFFIDGVNAIPDLVKSLTDVLERISDEKWLNLMDETELVAYQPPSTEELEEEVRRADGKVILLGATTAAILVGVLISLGVPAGAVVPGALIFLLGPATVWGSKKVGNPREMLDAFKGGITQPSEQQPASDAASNTPTSGNSQA